MIAVPADGYVTSDTCISCHPREYASWYRSYHRTMTQVASGESVLADFEDVTLDNRGRRYELRRDDNGFFVKLIKDT